jgi:hypothetical protein
MKEHTVHTLPPMVGQAIPCRYAPDEAGDYVLRYHLASSYRVIGSTPLKITPATASFSAPVEVVGEKFRSRVEGTRQRNRFHYGRRSRRA